MYWMPNSLILARTCFTSWSRPEALTWASKSVIDVPFEPWLPATSRAGRRGRCLAPRKRAVGGRMQFTLGETREAKRLQQLARPPADVLGHQLADAAHPIAVVRIGHHVD